MKQLIFCLLLAPFFCLSQTAWESDFHFLTYLIKTYGFRTSENSITFANGESNLVLIDQRPYHHGSDSEIVVVESLKKNFVVFRGSGPEDGEQIAFVKNLKKEFPECKRLMTSTDKTSKKLQSIIEIMQNTNPYPALTQSDFFCKNKKQREVCMLETDSTITLTLFLKKNDQDFRFELKKDRPWEYGNRIFHTGRQTPLYSLKKSFEKFINQTEEVLKE